MRILCLTTVALAGLQPTTADAQSWQNAATYGTQPAAASTPTTVAWPVANRAFERGDVLTEQDFVTQQLPARSAVGLLSLDTLVGKAASRPISAGTALRQSDVMEPQLVYRGAPVKVHVRLGGIDIASTGRALSDGQYGQTIRIFSNVSSRTLEAVVEGAGVVHLAGF